MNSILRWIPPRSCPYPQHTPSDGSHGSDQSKRFRWTKGQAPSYFKWQVPPVKPSTPSETREGVRPSQNTILKRLFTSHDLHIWLRWKLTLNNSRILTPYSSIRAPNPLFPTSLYILLHTQTLSPYIALTLYSCISLLLLYSLSYIGTQLITAALQAQMASKLVLLFILFSFLHLLSVASFEFEVGEDKGWAVPPPDDIEFYNEWASKNRFQIGDAVGKCNINGEEEKTHLLFYITSSFIYRAM